MNKRILIIAADNLGIGFHQVEYPDIEYLKFPVLIGDKEYRESDTYTADWLIEKYKTENIVAKSTSLVKGEIIEIVERNKDKYDLIVHVVMSSIMSSATFNIAEDVRKMFEKTIPIINIDTRQVVNGVGVILLRIIDIINYYENIDDIVSLSNEVIKNTFTFFVMGDLKYLYRGGRIGKAKALMGSVLKIIPVVGLMGDDKDGEVIPMGKGRTFKQANSLIVNSIKEKMTDRSIDKATLISILNVNDNPDAVSDLKEKVEDSVPLEKMILGEPHFVEAIYLGPRSYCISICLK